MSYNFTCNHLVFMFLIRINYRESLLLKWWKDTSFISIHLIPKCLGFQVYLSFQWLMIPGPWDLACCWSQAKGVDRPCFCSKQIRWSKKKIAITFSLHFFYWFIKYSFSLNLFYKCQILCSIFLALNIIVYMWQNPVYATALVRGVESQGRWLVVQGWEVRSGGFLKALVYIVEKIFQTGFVASRSGFHPVSL